MKMTDADIQEIAFHISNFMYRNNKQAVSELVELFDGIHASGKHGLLCKRPLEAWEDYVRMYDDNFYTYATWEDLVYSEKGQNDGLTDEELREQMEKTVWQLPCGWYVQYV